MDARDACQVISNTEALGVLTTASKRLRSSSCTLPKDRRNEVKWVVARCARYLSGAADPITATRVLDALASVNPPLPPLTKLKLLNAQADNEVAVYLADETVDNRKEVASLISEALGQVSPEK
jgi:hypothetical protein